ncbi:Rab3 GTPase-activating protein catalytic subunit [Vitis vinifera]|uniref:Rab3 GTPase-activating protein catalytic subunit n=1 Tax=Vitis vinifera TaxID=29760 RepID=A0A438DXK2_VITVI|nr:Rab3 GTPase-activating protein catalytic subunit [Vitis vinifera]
MLGCLMSKMVVAGALVGDALFSKKVALELTQLLYMLCNGSFSLHFNYEELRKLWSEEQYVPDIPLDEIPDLNCCLLYQQLQVINCCISRKRRHVIATESLDSVIREAGSNIEEPFVSKGLVDEKSILYARISTGELVLRLGAGRPSDNLMMLETGEPIYVPVTQEGPLLTEDLIKETEEFVLRTGSVGAGCSQLLSDMQAFKAANPGSILEDFVRWHSPPDWTDTEPSDEFKDTFDGGDSLSARGQLSSRMRKEGILLYYISVNAAMYIVFYFWFSFHLGNLWCELWKTAKPLPAVKQAPLFDEDLAVEGILHFLDDIPPSELFKQLFVSLLGLGFVIAEATLSTNSNLSKLFHECKDYTIATCQRGTWVDKIDDLCQVAQTLLIWGVVSDIDKMRQNPTEAARLACKCYWVYETVEMMLLHPEEILKIMKQPEEAAANADEPKRRFRRLAQIFGGKDRPARKPASKDQNVSEENPIRQPFSNMFDGRSSLFSKKPPKPDSTITADKPPLEENDWTIV